VQELTRALDPDRDREVVGLPISAAVRELTELVGGELVGQAAHPRRVEPAAVLALVARTPLSHRHRSVAAHGQRDRAVAKVLGPGRDLHAEIRVVREAANDVGRRARGAQSASLPGTCRGGKAGRAGKGQPSGGGQRRGLAHVDGR
jgi:hypothetical protein